jgi:hypothetical protein
MLKLIHRFRALRPSVEWDDAFGNVYSMPEADRVSITGALSGGAS